MCCVAVSWSVHGRRWMLPNRAVWVTLPAAGKSYYTAELLEG